ncbi:PQQ-binding-like beta-propeller repeat protein [Streptomyces sp. ISL-1]|uniref:outer membrane protein assembly factor BamB family protein n=1 Tax=Streptomyces sp. ISL-1 TaxID=2817657 RepID=UPI001BE78A3E|nr:PQQ-binding-like beta-propeller repeat protein [Streptomyces sp. ISL-1]MBT2392700.1 PQQ-binding-like beta-propeller repeat protein [Streptomyces sp. ISL-1]
MTQPPPPPNQPPQGGFGAPQDVPPGGFGAPTPPPQAPSYGYPQTPPPAQPPQGPPPGQPGYGYPQAPGQAPGQPPGYGYPQGPPPAQPGYGYPTQPMQPQYMPPQSGGSGGKKLSTQMQIIIAASLAVVLIVVGGIWYASSNDGGGGKNDESKNSSDGSSAGSTGGDSGGKAADGPGNEKAPANVNSKVAFQLPEPTRTDITSVKGSWVTDKAYVKPGMNSLVGYDAAKGTPLWTLPLSGQVCAASRHLSEDNKAAILFEATKRVPPKNFEPCTEVGVVDLSTGKLLWSKSVKGTSRGDEKIRFTEVTQSGNTVAAGGTDGGAAFDLTSGAVRWKPTANAEGCYDMGYGGGPALVAVRKCGSYDSPQVIIQGLNPDNGTPAFSYKMPAGVEYASIVSSKPLVVAADVGDTGTFGISDFFSLDEKGTLKAKIPAAGDKFQARCGSTEVESCQKIVVGNGRLYLPTADHEGTGEYGDTNEIVSFDLATGKPTADRSDAGDRYTMFPLRMDGGNLIAYKWPPYDKGGQVVSIDGGTFKQTVLMENPADKAVRAAETSFSSDYAEYRYANGRLYVGAVLLSKPSSSSSTFGKKYLTVAFSTAD